jgi:cytochrome c553
MPNDRTHKRDRARVFALLVSLSLLGGCDTYRWAGGRPAQSPESAAAARLPQCASCHQEDGVSRAEIFPNLAGQQKDYIVAQLTAFRDHTRRDRDAKTYMWGPAAGLNDETIKILAADYAAKSPPLATSRKRNDVVAGEAIFERGIAAQGVLACASCHGARGEGNAAIPRVAGQHAGYLVVQLGAFASGSRDNAVMHLIAKSMTPEEVKDVSVYLSSP